MKKRYQVFISSTYLDMRKERQSAVEAILQCGHIPAGMELFAADSESQFNVIKKWIRDCDIFILILGARYGSIPNNEHKSYIQKEYEYAKHIGKKPIAILISYDGVKQKIANGDYGVNGTDWDDEAYRQFREGISKSRTCSFFSNIDELRNRIADALRVCEARTDLTGWVRGDGVEQVSHYLYSFDQQEYYFKYIDMCTIEYTKTFKIRFLVNGIQYYTDRFAWNARGRIEKHSNILAQRIVDEFIDSVYNAYTIRLEEPSIIGKTYDISVTLKISDCDPLELQHLTQSPSVPTKRIILCVEVPDTLELRNCQRVIYNTATDRVPKICELQEAGGNHLQTVFTDISIGKKYGIEWHVTQKT